MPFRPGKIERVWTGYVRIGAERVRLFVLVGVLAGVASAALWAYVTTWGPGQRHLLDYAYMSFKAYVGSDEEVSQEIGGKVFRGNAEKFRAWMAENWYRGRSVGDIAEQSFYVGLGGAVLTVVLVIFWSTRHSVRGEDEAIRGPRLYEPAELDRELREEAKRRGDPMGLTLGEVQIDKRAEASHMLLLGDSGAGKSSAIRLILAQIREAGEAAIIYDPEREFLSDFYVEGLDTILNPLDARSPFWTPWEEATHTAGMEALATSFVPDPSSDAGNSKFWIESARSLLVAMLEKLGEKNEADPRQIAKYLNAPLETLEGLIQGTAAANAVNASAPQQAQGVLATLGTAVRSLKLLRPPEDGATRFSAREWAQKPRGWVFLTSTEEYRKATLPLISVWIDCLIRPLLDRSLEEGKSEPVWLVADELHTLQRLATLPDIVTRGRKFQIRAVLGTQSMAQFQSLYGQDSKTLLSQPKTKLIYRCSEPETAKWSSDLIGQAEKVTQRASMSVTGKESFNLAEERRIDAVVLPSEIQKMPDLTCFMIHAGKIAQMALPIVKRLHRVEPFIERKTGAADSSTAAA